MELPYLTSSVAKIHRYFLFVGWLTVADALGDPFRSWSDEYDWEHFVKALFVNSQQLASGLRDDVTIHLLLTS